MNQEETEEIDLLSIFKTLIDNKKTIIKFVFVFFLLGLFFAIFTPKKFSTSTVFIPQGSSNKGGGNLGGLAALAGVSFGSSGNDEGIPLSLYSEIINSVPFQRKLVKLPLLKEEGKKAITFEEYYTNIHSPGLISNLKKYTIGLPGVIINSLKGEGKDKETKKLSVSDSILYISNKDEQLFQILKGSISLTISDEDNSVRVSGVMPQPILAAGLTYNTQKLLESYIIDFKIEKSSSKLGFIKERYIEAEKVYKKKQFQLANYQDRNKFLTSAKSQTRLANLQSEYNLAYSVYSELAKQIETQQIQVKEDTPVFTIIKPVSVPNVKTEPKGTIIISAWLFLGVFLSLLVIFGKKYYFDLKSRLS
ncbi:hypothetical protein LPB136_06605 [Tenacibaculum todarodis]|uniref:Polysaccharide chain length determinant N-terminal domain-containing protein n=1 Tax=Tenacibaculum todarodis TaxID=1850252 RepID=A0A1L3JIV9_9FLAO|nr:Wzz/FepE/Etk N-terminal domain-containing protein [Tenacibaculum todarodis]APG65047.1 hypothetical protein LPB136_06605 [Tenacibaculum todarodis]